MAVRRSTRASTPHRDRVVRVVRVVVDRLLVLVARLLDFRVGSAVLVDLVQAGQTSILKICLVHLEAGDEEDEVGSVRRRSRKRF